MLRSVTYAICGSRGLKSVNVKWFFAPKTSSTPPPPDRAAAETKNTDLVPRCRTTGRTTVKTCRV